MASVINRTTYEYLESVHSPNYPNAEWLRNPDLSAVESVPKKYWKVVSDTVVEMDQTEKDAVDAALEEARIAAMEAQVVDLAVVDGDEITSPEIRAYYTGNAVWTDPVSGLKGSPHVIQCFVNRREIFGDSENPVGEYSGNLLSRASNLETIHGKLGWHQQQITEALYSGPKRLLVYYGYPNSFNSATNGWDNEKVAQDMAKYGLIVFGNGVFSSGHADYANALAIVARVKALNPEALLFGYADTTLGEAAFETVADEIDSAGLHGVFFDQFGYDYGNTRADQNTRVEYVHSLGNASLCFVNAWNEDHVLGVVDDLSFPNSTYNSGLVESSLTNLDWYLLESHAINESAYSGNDGYQSKTDWMVRTAKAINLRAAYGINTAAVGIVGNGSVDGSALSKFGFISALMATLEAWGTSDTNYGASSAAVQYWVRDADSSKLGRVKWYSPSIQVDGGDADVCLRYVENGVLSLDFSPSAQSGSIVLFDSV